MGLKYHHKCPYKREIKGDYTFSEESNVKMKANIGVMWLQAKDCWQPLEVGRVKKQILP